ncbi:MAG: hypothetical protein LLF95_11175 [Bacteroidales bacterium]|nr:hypothetical protein [Bacteroidales bacterium]
MTVRLKQDTIMPAFKKITTKEQLQESLLRNRRFGLKNGLTVEKKQNNEFQQFLEWYVFNRMNTTPAHLIQQIQTQYYAEQSFRDRRQKNIDFTRGRQFNEVVWDSEIKRWVSQLEYLKRRNIPPLTYNVISKFTRSLVGQFGEMNMGNIVSCESREERGTELANALTICLEKIKNDNKWKNKDSANFEEMLESGRPVFKVLWETKDNQSKIDVKYRNLSPTKFCTNPGIVDYDMDNLHNLTEIHDVGIDDIIRNFANEDYEKGQQIRKEYIKYQGDETLKSSYNFSSFDGSQLRNMNFMFQSNSSYRYLEHWTLISDYEAITYDPIDGTGIPVCHKWESIDKVKKAVDAENEIRLANSEGISPDDKIFIEFRADYVTRAYVIYMTPWGTVLDVRESPYKDSKFPYVFTPPGINGELWGLVEELINAQLGLDRQISQADAVIANAAKGIWLIPDTAIPDDYSNKEYINEIKKTDGAIIYKVRDGAEEIKPTQQFANSANISAEVQNLIKMYSNLVDEISGNYGAAQGRDTSTKTASGYAMETNNAGLNVRPTMDKYLTLLVDRDKLILKFILEGYTKEDYKRIIGDEVDPRELTQYDFKIEQSKGTNSLAYKLQLEQELLQLVYQQLIPFDVFMDISSNPVMIQAKQKMAEYNKKMAQNPQGLIPGQMPIPGQQTLPQNNKPQITPANVHR